MAKEREAIEIVEGIVKSYIEADECGLSNNDFKHEIRALQTVLNMLKEKDKIIDLMAEVIYKKINRNGLKKYCNKDKSNCESYKECFECIKQYFERKCEE